MSIKRLVKYWVIFVVLFITFDLPFDLGDCGTIFNTAGMNGLAGTIFTVMSLGLTGGLIVYDSSKGDK